MAKAKLPRLALLWYILVIPVVIIDAIFVIYRRPTSEASKPHPLADVIPFKYWTIYEQYDKRYAPNGDAFVIAQSYLNLMEVALGFLVVLLACTSHNKAAVKLSMLVSLMTLYKTIMYFAMELADDFAYTGHNSIEDTLLMVALPSSFWIVIPAIIVKQCWDRLQLAEAVVAPQKSKKQPNKKA